ncbi:hypothetical protein J0H58_36245 [bacterium]|nr:hypothetical protein [bacterium]
MSRTVLRVVGLLLGGAGLLAAVAAGTMFRFENAGDLDALQTMDQAIGCVLALAVVLILTPPPDWATGWWFAASLTIAVIVGATAYSTLNQIHLDADEAYLRQIGVLAP